MSTVLDRMNSFISNAEELLQIIQKEGDTTATQSEYSTLSATYENFENRVYSNEEAIQKQARMAVLFKRVTQAIGKENFSDKCQRWYTNVVHFSESSGISSSSRYYFERIKSAARSGLSSCYNSLPTRWTVAKTAVTAPFKLVNFIFKQIGYFNVTSTVATYATYRWEGVLIATATACTLLISRVAFHAIKNKYLGLKHRFDGWMNPQPQRQEGAAAGANHAQAPNGAVAQQPANANTGAARALILTEPTQVRFVKWASYKGWRLISYPFRAIYACRHPQPVVARQPIAVNNLNPNAGANGAVVQQPANANAGAAVGVQQGVVALQPIAGNNLNPVAGVGVAAVQQLANVGVQQPAVATQVVANNHNQEPPIVAQVAVQPQVALANNAGAHLHRRQRQKCACAIATAKIVWKIFSSPFKACYRCCFKRGEDNQSTPSTPFHRFIRKGSENQRKHLNDQAVRDAEKIVVDAEGFSPFKPYSSKATSSTASSNQGTTITPKKLFDKK